MTKDPNNGPSGNAQPSGFEDIVRMHPDGVLVLDGAGQILYANTAGVRLLCRMAGIEGDVPEELNVPAGNSATVTLADAAGCDMVLEVASRAVEWGGHAARLLYINDVTRHTSDYASLEQLVYNDHLTGLYNRRGLELVAEHHWAVAARDEQHVVAFFIDLDGLKQINDSRGHNAGDQAIAELSEVVCSVFRDADIKARIGGDEFVVLVNEDGANVVDNLLERIRHEVDDRNAYPARPYQLSISIGIGRHGPEESFNMAELLRVADKSMYRAKQQRGNDAVRHVDGGATRTAAVAEEDDLPRVAGGFYSESIYQMIAV
ncbi:MAG: sensor domain-containing diguanylate cyclase [Pseudomonadota bacterium]|nr:MAG: sensor domain-containing diguanylate cyclase [Pseudomonadota bacterium]